MTDLSDMPGYRPGETDTRPWGKWEVLETGTENGEEYCVKILTVNPGGILSLQYHNYRREYWIVLEGALELELDGAIIPLETGASVEILVKAKHRLINRTDLPAVFKEIQRGICREDDNIRLEDAYGRTTQQA